MLTCGVAGLGTERQDFDIFVIGAGSQQLPTLAPGNTVDGTFVMFVPLETHRWLLDWTGPTEGRWIQIKHRCLSAGCTDQQSVCEVLAFMLNSVCRCVCRRWPDAAPRVYSFWVSADSECLGVGTHGVERPRWVEGNSSNSLGVFQCVHWHKQALVFVALWRTNKTRRL